MADWRDSPLHRPHPRVYHRKLEPPARWDANDSPSSSTQTSSSNNANLEPPAQRTTVFNKLRDSIIPQSAFFSEREFNLTWRKLGDEEVPVFSRTDERHPQSPLRPPRRRHRQNAAVAEARLVESTAPLRIQTQQRDPAQSRHQGHRDLHGIHDSTAGKKRSSSSKALSLLSGALYKAIFWKSRDPARGKRKHQFPRPWTKIDPNDTGFPGTQSCGLDPVVDKTAVGHGHGQGHGHGHGHNGHHH